MFNQQELQMLLILLNRVQIAGNEAENLVVLKRKATEMMNDESLPIKNLGE